MSDNEIEFEVTPIADLDSTDLEYARQDIEDMLTKRGYQPDVFKLFDRLQAEDAGKSSIATIAPAPSAQVVLVASKPQPAAQAAAAPPAKPARPAGRI